MRVRRPLWVSSRHCSRNQATGGLRPIGDIELCFPDSASLCRYFAFSQKLLIASRGLGICRVVLEQRFDVRREALREGNGSDLPPGLHSRIRKPPRYSRRPPAPYFFWNRIRLRGKKHELECTKKLVHCPRELHSFPRCKI